jgi:hypothetical protein
MGLKFRQREAGAGPRLFPNDLIFPPKVDEATKILKQKVAAEPKISKREAAVAATKAAVSGAISELICDKPTKSKVREYMKDRAISLTS